MTGSTVYVVNASSNTVSVITVDAAPLVFTVATPPTKANTKDDGGTQVPPSSFLPCLLATARVAGKISRGFPPIQPGHARG